MECGLIGEHLPHSFSPEIHKLIGDYTYELCELTPEEVGPFLEKRDFRAINVTIPYKQTVMPYLDEISKEALTIGAVNTVVNRGGKLYGYNTDFGGMTALIESAGITVKDKKVLILGSGGTAHTAQAVCTALGAKQVLTVSRHPVEGQISYEQALDAHTDAQVLVNTTPCGMFPHPETMAIDPLLFSQLEGVVDAVYNPLRTRLTQRAAQQGVRVKNGLFMLAFQAVLAAEHFFDTPISAARAKEICSAVWRSKENIVLTGMPASGKSTVGKRLAAMLDRPFVDLDEEIVKDAGCAITDIFRNEGEAAFRDRESRVLKQVAMRTGCVIATGGGAVLREENVQYLRQNGRLYFLDRPLDMLCPTDDRPTASDREALRRRYEERYDIYCRCCDKRISADGTVEEVANAVKGDFCDDYSGD